MSNSNITSARILSQMRQQNVKAQRPKASEAYEAISVATKRNPIPIDELRKILTTELEEKPIEQNICVATGSLHFENIYEFVTWYSSHQSQFSIAQRTALDTLLQVRTAIEQGCVCKRNSREVIAHQYFANFWTNNCRTDLLATVAKIAEVSKVSVGSLCSYPVNIS